MMRNFLRSASQRRLKILDRVFFLALGLLFLALLSQPPCWAGDQMNIVFLSNQAIQKSQILNLLQQELNDELYGTSATDRVMTGLSLFTEGLWGASMGIAHPAMSLATGVSASGLSLGSEMVSEIRNRRNNKCIQRLLKEIKQQTNLLQREVRLLYYGFKEGADTATMRLVQLVGESSVNEVRENIEMENYFRAKWAEEKLVKPVARNSPDH